MMDLGRKFSCSLYFASNLTGSTLNGYLQGANGMKGEKGDSGLPGPQGPSSPWRLNVQQFLKSQKWASYSPPTSTRARWLINSKITSSWSVVIQEISVSLVQGETKVSQRSESEAIFQENYLILRRKSMVFPRCLWVEPVHVEPMFFLVFSPELSEIFESLIVVVALYISW